MEEENLFKLAELAKQKGFTTQTVTTNFTNNYLLNKGKRMFINDMCFYLWLCELKKWLEDKHSIYFQIQNSISLGKPYSLLIENNTMWKHLNIGNLGFEKQEQALEYGCYESLKIIDNE